MITPDSFKNENDSILKELEEKIDKSMLCSHGEYPWEEALITGEYSVELRNKIASRYMNAGWKYAYHQTSSENGERPGLTIFKFSMTELDEQYVKKYHKVHGD